MSELPIVHVVGPKCPKTQGYVTLNYCEQCHYFDGFIVNNVDCAYKE